MQETETIEFKKSLAELKEGLISMVAILNKHQAGELWFGVRNDGKPVGLIAGEKTLRDVSQAIAAHIEPKIYPAVETQNLEGVTCIRVAFSGKEAPYFAYGRAYLRVADADRQVSAKELENLILAKNRDQLRWDHEPSTATLDDMDAGKLQQFVRRAGLGWDNSQNALEKLGLIQNGLILRPALLFFAHRPCLQLRCAVFAGTTSSMIIDRHDYEGDMLELIDEAQKYILKNIHIGMRLKGLEREDIPEIPTDALREAIINAFCHRDYRDLDPIQVAIFKDRVEIRNPGGLFEGLTLQDLKQGRHISKRRNPLIAELLRRVHLVEAWGRGIALIMEQVANVEFRETAGVFITEFKRTSPSETPQKPLKNPEEQILAALKMHPTASMKTLASLCGLTLDSTRHHIDKLKGRGIIRHIGPSKGGEWKVL